MTWGWLFLFNNGTFRKKKLHLTCYFITSSDNYANVKACRLKSRVNLVYKKKFLSCFPVNAYLRLLGIKMWENTPRIGQDVLLPP